MPDPVLNQAEPQLYATDLAASLAFWRTVLGFRPAFVHGDPPFYAQVARGGARLNLRRVDGPVRPADFLERTLDALAATVTVEGVEALEAEFAAAGAPFHQPLRTEPWGARTFIVRDPDGNLILFAGEGDA